MPETKPQQQHDAPFGTQPRRPVWPLTVLIVIFALWFLFLVWMAIQFPAR